MLTGLWLTRSCLQQLHTATQTDKRTKTLRAVVTNITASYSRSTRFPVAERSKARVCGRSLAGIAGSNPAGGMDVCIVCIVKLSRYRTGQALGVPGG